jgi:hopanoid biosynthesis associated RND transporter like protein HpnN
LPSSVPRTAPQAEEPSRLGEGLVLASIRRPWLVIAAALVLTVLAAWVTATRFAITTETSQLIETNDDWARNNIAFEKAFPHLAKLIVAVVDGETPELAEKGAATLVASLRETTGARILSAWRPDGGPFFDRNGLLLLPLAEVRETTEGLLKQQELLLALAGDPSLRGLLRLVQLGADRGALAENGSLLDRLTATIDTVLRGEKAHLSWQSLMSGKAPEPRETRKFVLVDPELDYDALEPASVPIAAIRKAASDKALTPENGIRVRLTGMAPLADEEFGTVRAGAPLHLGLSIVAIAIVLFLALRSGRVIAAVLATTFVGLIITIALGLLMVGRLNVISVAVAALFLGLGVDFGIQVAVRYRDERHKLDDVREALRRAGRGIGWSLTLAALSLLAGFFAFLPTSFKGVSELGLITGVGMIVAFLSSLTLLPALIALMRPPGEPDTVESPWLAAFDHWILANRKLVIGASVALVLAGLPFLLKIEFDANPMHLRSEKTEGVATFLDLTRTPGQTPNTISVLSPATDVKPLVEKLGTLPEVERVVSLSDFVPSDQEAKLHLIRKTAEEFVALTDPAPPAPAPSDAELVEQIRKTTASLRKGNPGEGDPKARLASALDRLAAASPDRRAAAAEALVGGLPVLFEKLRLLLSPEPITQASLPEDLRRDWLSKDGQVRIEVVPKGDANDNAVLERFSDAVKRVAPNVSGPPIEVVEAARVISHAFALAGALALAAIFVILVIALRNVFDVALTLGPLVIATLLTLEAAYLIGMPLNLANIIALPLMLAVGVNFHIYYMIAWRNGVSDMLASSLTRAIFFSSLVTGIAFGSLWLSNHPGTASMGKLLTISLVFTLLAAFVAVPAFLGPPRQMRSVRSGTGTPPRD